MIVLWGERFGLSLECGHELRMRRKYEEDWSRQFAAWEL